MLMDSMPYLVAKSVCARIVRLQPATWRGGDEAAPLTDLQGMVALFRRNRISQISGMQPQPK